jgi:hypothetical protein
VSIALHWRSYRPNLVAARKIEGFGGRCGEQDVALRRPVHPIAAPGIRLDHRRRAIEIDEPQAVAIGLGPDRLVHAQHPRGQDPADGNDARNVGKRCGEDGRTGLRELCVHQVQIGQCAIEEQSGAGDVVHANADTDQIRSHRQGLGQLVVEHIADAAAADRQIGVPQARGQSIEHRGQPVSETHDPVGIVSVPKPLGLTVAKSDVAGEHTVRHARDSSGRTRSG